MDEAIHRFQTIDPSLTSALNNVTVQIDDLDGGRLGTSVGTTILLDISAAESGWFIDPTPADDLEFQTVNPAIQIGVDLLTVLSHELGHIVELAHEDDPTHPKAERLAAGVRRTIHEEELDAIDFAFRRWNMDSLE